MPKVRLLLGPGSGAAAGEQKQQDSAPACDEVVATPGQTPIKSPETKRPKVGGDESPAGVCRKLEGAFQDAAAETFPDTAVAP